MIKEYIVCDLCELKQSLDVNMAGLMMGRVHVCHKCLADKPGAAEMFQAVLRIEKNDLDSYRPGADELLRNRYSNT